MFSLWWIFIFIFIFIFISVFVFPCRFSCVLCIFLLVFAFCVFFFWFSFHSLCVITELRANVWFFFSPFLSFFHLQNCFPYFLYNFSKLPFHFLSFPFFLVITFCGFLFNLSYFIKSSFSSFFFFLSCDFYLFPVSNFIPHNTQWFFSYNFFFFLPNNPFFPSFFSLLFLFPLTQHPHIKKKKSSNSIYHTTKPFFIISFFPLSLWLSRFFFLFPPPPPTLYFP